MADGTDDREYYARRASEERRIASECEDNAAELVHSRMADEYDRRARGPIMRIVAG